MAFSGSGTGWLLSSHQLYPPMPALRAFINEGTLLQRSFPPHLLLLGAWQIFSRPYASGA